MKASPAAEGYKPASFRVSYEEGMRIVEVGLPGVQKANVRVDIDAKRDILYIVFPSRIDPVFGEQRITLPIADIDGDRVTSQFKDNALTVKLPLKPTV